MTASTSYTAVFWDFGGVILSSPFEAFRRYEADRGLPLDTIRSINAVDPDANAWARFERSEISAAEFDSAFAVEARTLGFDIQGYDVLQLLRGDIRPEMVHALRTVKDAGFKTACLTNNVVDSTGTDHGDAVADRSNAVAEVMSLFDTVVESSKVGCRKPEVEFYEIACRALDVHPPACVFLDDLGVNLKPAAAMGMTTIKVLSADQAISDLENVLGLHLRA
ncbi:MAG: HAD-IA family hydrolase [Actinomycetota bacterium]